MYICQYCECNNPKKSYIVKEMMFGSKEPFEYLECASCGGLQISNIPQNISKYYPSNYYSLNYTRDNLLKRFIKKSRFHYSFTRHGIFGKILVNRFGDTPLAKWLIPTGISFYDAILDVGCGNGSVLIQMHDVGFTNLTGIDPFIENDLELDYGLRILKRDVYGIDSYYKLIMFHHSLEHVDSPFNQISSISKFLEPGQFILIRIPVVGGYAWREYSIDWVQIDAPRHLSIPTIKSMEVLAKRAGFSLEKIVFDSSEFQFWGSEQYRKKISYYDDCSYAMNPNKSIFTQKEIMEFKNISTQLNVKQDGDQACFYFRKT